MLSKLLVTLSVALLVSAVPNPELVDDAQAQAAPYTYTFFTGTQTNSAVVYGASGAAGVPGFQGNAAGGYVSSKGGAPGGAGHLAGTAGPFQGTAGGNIAPTGAEGCLGGGFGQYGFTGCAPDSAPTAPPGQVGP